MTIISMNNRKPYGQEVSGLENASVGYLAGVPGRPDLGFAQKVRESGKTWLHGESGERVTAYMAYEMGFRAPEHEPVETLPESTTFGAPSTEVAFDHCRRLMNAGMTLQVMADRIGIALRSMKQFAQGKTPWSKNPDRLVALMRIPVPAEGTLPLRHGERLPVKDRLEDLEWLLVSGVPWQDAMVRAGFPTRSQFSDIYDFARDHDADVVISILEQTESYQAYATYANNKENAA